MAEILEQGDDRSFPGSDHRGRSCRHGAHRLTGSGSINIVFATLPARTVLFGAAVLVLVVLAAFLTTLWLERSSPSLQEFDPPWTMPVPALAPGHLEAAKELAQYLRILPGNGYQERVRGLAWTTFWQHRPIGNLHLPALQKLLIGHWFVYRETPGDRDIPDGPWQVLYFGKDGIMWSCTPAIKDGYRLRRLRYEIVSDLAGTATYVVRRGDSRDDEAWLEAAKKSSFEWPRRPIVFDAILGTLAIYNTTQTGHWYRWIGHLQREYHPAFTVLCPDIPQFTRPGLQTQQATVPRTYEEFREVTGQRAIIKNVNTLFRQDPSDPLTMGMYFALYPPPAVP